MIQKAGPPTLATGPPKPGEIVLVGRATPRIYGPYSFPPGGFVVRFQEFDPTRPGVEPSADGSRFMVALLARDRVPSGKPSRVILNTTAPIGATRATARAKRYVYVSYSGKYAYVLRLTP